MVEPFWELENGVRRRRFFLVFPVAGQNVNTVTVPEGQGPYCGIAVFGLHPQSPT